MIHSARAGAALRALREADPALAVLSLWCSHRDHDGPTETVGAVIRYGPGFATLPLHEQVGLAGHHVLHVALQHSARMAAMQARLGEGFAPDLWGIAADAIVNEVLVEAGHALPRPALTLTGLLAAAFDPSPQHGQALAEWDVERLYHRLADGTGAAGAGDKARAHAAAQGHGPDLRPAPGDEAAKAGDGTDSAADWRAHLARAMAAGAVAGFGIGRLGARLADLPQPRVPWEAVLRRLVQRATLPQPRQTMRRPGRAWLALEAEARRHGGPVPVFQPGTLRQTDAPRIVLGLDCSTSIDTPRHARFLAELAGLARRGRAELHLLAFDTEVRVRLRLDPGGWSRQLAALDLPEGGGTDFRPLLAEAARLGPSALVVLTDLEGPAGDAPRFPVIWAVPDAPQTPSAPFGHVLSLAH